MTSYRNWLNQIQETYKCKPTFAMDIMNEALKHTEIVQLLIKIIPVIQMNILMGRAGNITTIKNPFEVETANK